MINADEECCSHLPAETLRNVVWNIYRDVSIMGVEFSGLDTPSTEMTLRTYVYFDGLTKNEFVQKVLLTIRALSLAVRTFIRALRSKAAQKSSIHHQPFGRSFVHLRKTAPLKKLPLHRASWFSHPRIAHSHEMKLRSSCGGFLRRMAR